MHTLPLHSLWVGKGVGGFNEPPYSIIKPYFCHNLYRCCYCWKQYCTGWSEDKAASKQMMCLYRCSSTSINCQVSVFSCQLLSPRINRIQTYNTIGGVSAVDETQQSTIFLQHDPTFDYMTIETMPLANWVKTVVAVGVEKWYAGVVHQMRICNNTAGCMGKGKWQHAERAPAL